MPTFTANGIDIYFERRGDGPPLVFCNGSGGTLAGSQMVVDVFAARFDTVAHDQRGLGKTSIPPGPYSMTDYAADVAALLDHVGWERCRVAGVSFGGMVAQEFAVTWPERVERLALMCTSPGGGAGSSFPLQQLIGASAEERAARYPTLLDTRFTPEFIAAHDDARGLLKMMNQRTGGEKSDEVLRGEAEQLGARAGLDVGPRLGTITAPTLVAAGRYDGIAPLPNSEAIAARIPNAELRVYDGGHAFMAQDPSAIPEILDFLATD